MAKTTFTAEELARCVENEFFRRSQRHARVSSMRLKMIQGANRQMAMWEEIARRLRAEANAHNADQAETLVATGDGSLGTSG
jgi:uncharacterized membrane protein YgaE (UPF0421/DUF939 family)